LPAMPAFEGKGAQQEVQREEEPSLGGASVALIRSQVVMKVFPTVLCYHKIWPHTK